jgi:hypothetical protein
MNNAIPYMIQDQNIILVIDNKPHTINESHVSYNQILKALKESRWADIKPLVDVRQTIADSISTASKDSAFEIIGESIFRNGEAIHGFVINRIITLLKTGFDVKPMMNFLENLYQNPSNRSVTELYQFLEVGNLPITEDGHFLAYKRVRDDYLDVYTGTISNHVGAIVSMERNAVNDNSEQTCSEGLHFCSYEYLKHFSGSRIMILKINPRDVVSIPKDYNDTKGRCCLYEVVGEIGDTSSNKVVKDTLSKPLDTSYDKVPPKPYRLNKAGQWIDATGSFLAKRFIPV